MPPSSHCCLHPALCALIHRRAHRWVNVGGAGGSQKPSRHGKWACTCRYCGKRHRDGWARRREGLGWRTPRVRFHSQAPLWRGKEDLNNLLDFPCQIISNKYAVSNEVKRQRQKDVKFVQYLDWDHVWHQRIIAARNKQRERLTQGGGLSIEELQQHILKDWQCGSWEGTGWHRALLIHHLRLAAPLQTNVQQTVFEC